jgi:hypothetical protein
MAVQRLSARDLVAPTAALLVLAVGCATPSTWKDLPAAREHVATGLIFPDQVDGLPRRIASPSPATDEVDVSYASGGTTLLRITLTPLPRGKEPDLQGALEERARSRTASPLPSSGPPAPVRVLCSSEEVTFAYWDFPLDPSWSANPMPASIDIGALEPKFGWWFAAELSGHLVVIESQLEGNAIVAGPHLPLRDVFDTLGWPCRFPMSKQQQAAQRKAEPEIPRKVPRAAPLGAFDEDSTLGPRPVHRDPAPGTYAHARSTGRPHICETSAPSFFGEREEYVAYVEGDDFFAPGRDMHFARVDGVAYTWSDQPLNEDVVLLGRIRLRAYEDAYQRLMHHRPPRWEEIFTFVEPADGDPCTPSKPQRIVLPDREFRDVTDDVIARRRQYFEASVETLRKLPFTPRLPPRSLTALFPATRGHAGSTGYHVQYLAHGAGLQGEFSELSIGFRAHTGDAPASQCGESFLGRRICEHVATTARGLPVFRELRVVGSSSSNPRLPHYYAKVGDALVSLNYIYWSYGGPSGATAWRAHEFAPGELEAVFDSLQPVDAEGIVRFPGMRVSQ